MLPLFFLLCFAAFSEASVSFSNAIIYDGLDLEGVQEEIPLDKCTVGGCSIFVSVPQWNIEVTRNIFIYSKTLGKNQSLYSFATEYDQTTGTKTGFHTAETTNSIMNLNKKTDKIGAIVIYVVGSTATNYQSDQVEIFDAYNINNRQVRNKKNTMIMSAEPFNLYVQANSGNLQAIVRATGFDNNYGRTSPNNCRIIYDHNEAKPFRLRITSPIITINFDGLSNYQICAKIDADNNGAALDYPGMATSHGYVGCEANQFQIYRSSYSSAITLTDSSNTDRDVELTYVVNTKQSDKVDFTTFFQGGNKPFSATGDGKNSVTQTEKAQRITVSIKNEYGSSYWLGYTPKSGGVSIPSGKGICPDFIPTVSPPGSQTISPENPTTSGSNDLLTLLTSAIVCLFARQF